MSAWPDHAIGGRYQPIGRLGAGASGEVLLVVDRVRGGPPLALKRVPAARAGALQEEFRRLRALSSPGLPRVDELAIDPVTGDWLFTAEPGRGQPFLAALRAAPLALQLRAVADALRTLALLHERDVVHRDLKPEHLLVDGGETPRVMLVDFGLAVSGGAGAMPAGSLPYLAPELFRGDRAGHRSDLYAFGIVLYELWGGRHPFTADAPLAWAQAHLEQPLRFDAAFAAPAPLRELVARLLAKSPDERYASAGACLADLSRAAAEPLAAATAATLQGRIRSVPPHEPAWRETLIAGEPRPGGTATWVSAPTRAGRDALLRELRLTALESEAWPLVACFAPAAGAAPVRRAVYEQLAALTGSPLDTPVDLLLARLQRGDLPRRAVLFLEEAPQCAVDDEPFLRFLLRAGVEVVASGAATADADARVLVAWGPPIERRTVVARPLPAAEFARSFPQWLGVPLESSLARFLGAVEGAEVDLARAVELLCAAVDAGALAMDGRELRFDPSRIDLGAADGDLLDVTRARLAAIAGPRADLLAALALLEDAAERDLLAVLAPAASADHLDALIAAGLVERQGDRFQLGEGAVAALVRERVGASAGGLHALAARFLADHPERENAARRHARHAFRAAPGDPVAARAYAVQALACADASALAEADAIAREMLALAADADASRIATLVRGIVQLRRSSHAEAETLLAGLPEQLGAEPALADRARLEHARALERCGRPLDALARLAPPEGRADAPGAAAQRAYVLHLLQRDAEAESVCTAALALPRVAGDGGEQRLRSIHAVTLWRLGRFDEAREAFDRALAVARASGLPLQVAVVQSNRARFEEDCGNLRQAEQLAVGALATTVAFGDRQQEAMQLVNLANLRFDLGRFAECKAALQRSREIAHEMRQPGVLRRIDLIQAHVALNEADFAAAHAALDRSAAQARALGDERSAWRAELLRTEVLMREGKGLAARRLLDAATAEFERAGHDDERAVATEFRLQWATFAASRRLLAKLLAAPVPAAGSRRRRAFLRDARLSALHRLGRLDELATTAREQLADLAGAELDALTARAAAALALAERATPPGAERIAAARAAYAAVQAPGHLALRAEAALMLGRAARDRRLVEEAEECARRAGHRPLELRARALRRKLLPAGGADVEATARLRSLERLMRVAKQLAAAHDGEALLKLLLDDAVEATRAARGFLILNRGGELAVRCARNLDAADIERPELAFSSSVARAVAADGRPVLRADVSTEERWRDAASISELKLLSVLCVPIGRGERVIGSVYLDEPTRIDAFRPGDLRYVENLADFAAVVLEKIELLEHDRARQAELERSQQEVARLNQRLQSALLVQQDELVAVKASLERARQAAGRLPQFEGIVAQGAAMDEVKRRIDRVARSPLPVLVSGESGTGKELVARAIHALSGRAERPFEPFSCATTPPGLIENELFGHWKGAFTGAESDAEGLFERCNGGTLFLDEVAEASSELQAKLLRVVQSGEVQRLGGGVLQKVDVRILAATHRDLRAEVAAGRFREDLMYRLMVLQVHLPPLRERRDDIPLLLEHFVRREAERLGKAPPSFTPQAWRCLVQYDWPGNVRELEHAVQRLLVLHPDAVELGVEELRSELPIAVASEPTRVVLLREHLEAAERSYVAEVLARCSGSRVKAAKELGISERNLYQRLQRWRDGADRAPESGLED